MAFWNRQPKRDTEACRGILSFDAAFEQSYHASVPSVRRRQNSATCCCYLLSRSRLTMVPLP
ncbi:hypothetical protein [Xenorhabdus nematophila]|uniref:hypothetical protein n=1 Tax=Xenorhabdus nematophila TaxID=628 RepID=UPI002E24E45F